MELIDKQTIPERVVERVLQSIEENEFRPGDRLPTERELARHFGIARTSVREALKRLESMGVVTMKPGAGTFVTSLTIDKVFAKSRSLARLAEVQHQELIDILACRRHIEGETAAEAARRITDAQVAELRTLVERQSRLTKAPLEFIDCDLRFHVLIAEATGNSVYPLIVRMLRDLYLKSELAPKYASTPGLAESSLGHHRRILEAIEARSPEDARSAMVDHLRHNEAVFIELGKSLVRARPDRQNQAQAEESARG